MKKVYIKFGGGGSSDINVSSTIVNNGSDGGLFFNDNGVFEEMNGIKFDNAEGMFYNENYDDGGLKMSNIEIIYMGNTMSLPYAGIYGFPDSNGKQYFNGYMDGTQYGLGQLSINGWMDLLTGKGTYIYITAENNVNLNAENNVNLKASQFFFDMRERLGGNENFTVRGDQSNNLFEIHRTGLTKIVSNQFQLGSNSSFGQQLSTGTSATVDDLITVLQGMGILTQ